MNEPSPGKIPKKIKWLAIILVALFIILLVLYQAGRVYVLRQPQASFPLKLKWQVDLGRSAYDHPAYQDGLVFSTADGLIFSVWYAVEAEKGRLVWSRVITRGNFRRCLTSNYLVLSGPSSLIVLQKHIGRIVWSQDRPPADTATCSEEVVFSSGVPRDSILAYELATGRKLWGGTKPRKNINGLIYHPETAEIIARHAGDYYLVDPQTGILKHSFEEAAIPPNDGRPERGLMYLLDRGELFIGATVQDAQTGRVIHKEEHYGSMTPPTVTEDTMYLSAIFDGVVAFDRADYTIKWIYQPQPKKVEWLPLHTISSVAILDGTGYVILSDATLRAFDTETGQELGYWQPGWLDLWRWPVCTFPLFHPKCFLGFISARAGLASSEETLFVSFGDGKLYGFGR